MRMKDEDVSLVEFMYVVIIAYPGGVIVGDLARVFVVVGLRSMSCVTSIVRAQLILPIVC